MKVKGYYLQELTDLDVYIQIEGVYKNGNYYASMVRKYHNKRTPDKAKEKSINNPSLWTFINEQDIPNLILNKFYIR